MFINQVLSCQSCGALWPQCGRDSRRVQLWKWVCSPACSQSYLAQAAGLVDGSAVLPVSYGHRRNKLPDPGEAPLLAAYAGALPPGVLHDYRDEVDRIVEAVTPRNLDGFRGA